MPKVLVPLATGFEEIETTTIIDLLRRAQIEVISVCLDRRRVIGAHGIKILADKHINDIDYREFDMIVLPGGLPGSLNLKNSSKVQELLGKFDNDNKFIGAICAAPIALDSAKILKKAYTCYPSIEKEITTEGYINSEDVVSDQNIITSKGPATAFSFALDLIAKLAGEGKALEVKRGLLLG
jgi:protein deglycase